MDAGKYILIAISMGLVARALWLMVAASRDIAKHREISTK